MASFIFSRSDVDALVLPLLQQLFRSGEDSSHHLYMLLIVLLLLSQDQVFSKAVHEIVSDAKKVTGNPTPYLKYSCVEREFPGIFSIWMSNIIRTYSVIAHIAVWNLTFPLFGQLTYCIAPTV